MTRTAPRPNPHTVTVERTLEATGSTVRLVLEPRPEKQVFIVEYRRRRKPEGRFERVKSEEGKCLPFDLLNLDQGYEELFPQGGLFEEAAEADAAPKKVRRPRR